IADRSILPGSTWTAAQAEDWFGRWAMNLMLINVSTRKFRRAVRLPEGDLRVAVGDGDPSVRSRGNPLSSNSRWVWLPVSAETQAGGACGQIGGRLSRSPRSRGNARR